MGRASRRKKERQSKGRRGSQSIGLYERLKAFIRRNRVAVRSVLIFILCVGLAIFAYSRLVESNVLSSYLTFIAQSTGFMLNIFGAGAQVDGTLISTADFSMRIVNECTGIVAMLILLCAIIAYPSGIKQKALGMAIGLPALFLLNLARTVSLFYIGTSLASFFEVAHLLVWQSVMILAVIVIWIAWAKKVVHVWS